MPLPESPVPRRRQWFHLITPELLERAGPSRRALRGSDVYAGQPAEQPQTGVTVDKYDLAEHQVGRK